MVRTVIRVWFLSDGDIGPPVRRSSVADRNRNMIKRFARTMPVPATPAWKSSAVVDSFSKQWNVDASLQMEELCPIGF
jgi:hypothetical protein